MINITTDKKRLITQTVWIYLAFNGLFVIIVNEIIGNWWVMVLINILVTAWFLIFGYLDSLIIDEVDKTIKFIYKNWIRIIRIRNYSLDKIKYTYKKEATSPRGPIGKTLRLYADEKRIIRIHFMKYGWTKDKLDDLVNNLNNLGIQRKFVGYSLKDEYPDQ
jgi:hypothetical protein